MLDKPLEAGKEYAISIKGVQDCAGNTVAVALASTAQLAKKPGAGQVLINEILFNPNPNGLDFVELYNPSKSDWIDVEGLRLGNGTAAFNAAPPLPDLVLKAESYLWLAEAMPAVLNFYPKGRAENYLRYDLPSMNDDAGRLLLYMSDGRLVDSVAYTEKLHSSVLKDKEGVSLERINSNWFAGQQGDFAWCTEAAGWATPGFKNSQSIAEENSKGKSSASPPIISPDGDGVDDLTNLHFELGAGQWTAKVQIYDSEGRVARLFSENKSTISALDIVWDGLSDSGKKANTGGYMALCSYYGAGGRPKKIKLALAVAP